MNIYYLLLPICHKDALLHSKNVTLCMNSPSTKLNKQRELNFFGNVVEMFPKFERCTHLSPKPHQHTKFKFWIPDSDHWPHERFTYSVSLNLCWLFALLHEFMKMFHAEKWLQLITIKKCHYYTLAWPSLYILISTTTTTTTKGW